MKKSIVWEQVTSLSQLVAIVLFVAVFALGFWLGKTYEYHAFVNGEKIYFGSAPTAHTR